MPRHFRNDAIFLEFFPFSALSKFLIFPHFGVFEFFTYFGVDEKLKNYFATAARSVTNFLSNFFAFQKNPSSNFTLIFVIQTNKIWHPCIRFIISLTGCTDSDNITDKRKKLQNSEFPFRISNFFYFTLFFF